MHFAQYIIIEYLYFISKYALRTMNPSCKFMFYIQVCTMQNVSLLWIYVLYPSMRYSMHKYPYCGLGSSDFDLYKISVILDTDLES
jgi:hypothetical protein